MRGEGRYGISECCPGEYEECDVDPPPDCERVRGFDVVSLSPFPSAETSISLPSLNPNPLLPLCVPSKPMPVVL
jgi:hypothetical protein